MRNDIQKNMLFMYWHNILQNDSDERERERVYVCKKRIHKSYIGNNINAADNHEIRDINHYYLLATRHLYSIFERYAITRSVWPSSSILSLSSSNIVPSNVRILRYVASVTVGILRSLNE